MTPFVLSSPKWEGIFFYLWKDRALCLVCMCIYMFQSMLIIQVGSRTLTDLLFMFVLLLDVIRCIYLLQIMLIIHVWHKTLTNLVMFILHLIRCLGVTPNENLK